MATNQDKKITEEDLWDFICNVELFIHNRNENMIKIKSVMEAGTHAKLQQWVKWVKTEVEFIKKMRTLCENFDNKKYKEFEQTKERFEKLCEYVENEALGMENFIEHTLKELSTIEERVENMNMKVLELIVLEKKKLFPMNTKNLLEAAENGPVIALQFWLRETPEQLNKPQNNKFTPLQLAIRRKNLETVRYLIEEAKADVNEPSGHLLTTPLHEAVELECMIIIKLLLDNKARLNLVNHCNETPLHYAAKTGNVEVIKFLIEKGADKNICNKEGKKPQDLADKSIQMHFL